MIRLVVLNDNVGAPGLLNEWGWSIFIETGRYNVIFDADSSPRIIRYNAEQLGIDLGSIDYGFLSHHHGDHSGGYKALAEAKPGLTVYVPRGDTSYLARWGLKPVVVDEPTRIREGSYSTGSLWSGFLWEHGLVLKGFTKAPVLVVGCSHPGIDVIAKKAVEITGEKLLLVTGGFHGPEKWRLDNLLEYAEYIAPTHCSGREAVEYIDRKAPGRLVRARTGSIIRVDSGVVVEKY